MLDLPEITYPAELPIAAHRDEILALLRKHRVLVICGDTGSGKTTQIPKMALEAGLAGSGRIIACTQPRRLAAVTMAERVAGELKVATGGLVGYQHRYGRCLSRDTKIKFLTDGVLLGETRNDPLLRRYGCIIVDEAHERSLNIDFLLGILKRLLTRRRDLTVIVSSATLDMERFSTFFDHAPVLSVPGRLYPIETRYLPPPEDDERNLARDVASAVRTLPAGGDILVFLPGEREIRDCAETLESQRPGEDIIPLLASLPPGEQQRAFRLSSKRRIVLATNVAETSVTIPGIRYVIDSGLARLSRFIHKTQIQRLQIEPVSQASACQRAGRCGRIGPGICLRLYSEEDFLARDAYTPPEILRSSLAGVILTMLDLGLGDISRFPFLDPPRPAMITEGFRELIELGAVARTTAGEPCLSPIGRRLIRLPIEPRLARMLLAASERAALPSAIPVVAAMSCDDPRRRPVDARECARQAHAQFRVPASDFLGTLRLWQWFQKKGEELSQTKLRKLCLDTYLSYPKMREWRELVHQLERLCRELGFDTKNDNGGPDALHCALLTGLLGRIGKYDSENHEYRGARGLRFVLHPSSALAKKPPEWVMCGELVDTTRLFARLVTGIDVRWIEPAAGDLAKHHVHSPEWDARSGFVRATEQVTLYGLVIVPARRCDFSRVDPAFAREIFIRRGLIDGDFPQPPPEVRQNTAFLERLRQQAEKTRRHELFDEERLLAHFDGALPREICSAPALRKWLRAVEPIARERFKLKKADWWPSDRADDRDYPTTILIGNARMRLSYRHTPDDPEHDGITCSVARAQAAALRLWRADWLVPGLLPEKLMWMLSSLPTAQRKVLTPLDDTLAGLLAKLKPGQESLEDAVVRTVYEEWGFRISADAWRRAHLPNHLRVRFVIRDDADGHTLAAGRDLERVLEAAHVGGTSSAAAISAEKNPEIHADWSFGDLPGAMSASQAGWKLEHYPALVDAGSGVSIKLFADEATASRAHQAGVLRLYLLRLGPHARIVLRPRDLTVSAALYLRETGYSLEQLADDILAGAANEALVRNRPPVRTRAEFESRLANLRSELVRTQQEISSLALQSLATAAELLQRVERDMQIPEETADAVQTQLIWLICRGFPRQTPLVWLRQFPRYLKGATLRLERARNGRTSDRTKENRFAPYWERYRAASSEKHLPPETLVRLRWLLEEYRVSIFAQELRTIEPISAPRLDALFSKASSRGDEGNYLRRPV